ncbi:MAG: UDP-N-acetylmuramoyl-tripeptide--D-alanyl-D-alanine ligase [Bdellovibrionales bacterium]|nr:UDP-N-acetylmuramoyl-tripeptide--D-alanyl-D-alanine ligase [Bdellovibrionales bacterium]
MILNSFLLDDIIQGTNGKLVYANATEFDGISTDTRENNKGKLFIALKGETYDAHDFLEKAIESGAAAILVHKNEKQLKTNSITVIKVEDTLLALQDLGRYWRKKHRAKVIALTGTNGKTTTKESLSQILSEQFKVCVPKGSFNNHWGVPMSLLQLNSTHDFMISEMGMNHPGEIAVLCKIALPDVTMVTNVGRGHLEGVGSVEGVAKEKQEIYNHSPGSIKVFNLDNKYTKDMWNTFRQEKKYFTFSLKEDLADVYFSSVVSDTDGVTISGAISGVKNTVTVNVFGIHNAYNLAAAAAAALTCGMKPDAIWTALAKCHTIWGRNQWVNLASGARVLFDAYNANPESMGAFLQNTGSMKTEGRKFYVLGDMLELGSFNDKEHLSVAESLQKIDFEKAYFIGENGKLIKSAMSNKSVVISDTYKQNLAFELKSMLQPGDILFMKASRGIKLENFLLDLDPQNFSLKK